MTKDNEYEIVVTELLERVQNDGVGIVTVSDGHVFGFKKETLRELLAKAEASADGVAIVFVQRKALEKSKFAA